jgi:hypothetical protein
MPLPATPPVAGFSLHEQLLDRALAELLAGDTIADSRIERSRRDAVSAADLVDGPAITLQRGGGAYSPFANGADNASVSFTLHCWAKGDAWETVADALHVQAHTLLLASPAVAALVKGLSCTGTELQDQVGDEPIGHLVATYEAQAITRRADLGRALPQLI